MAPRIQRRFSCPPIQHPSLLGPISRPSHPEGPFVAARTPVSPNTLHSGLHRPRTPPPQPQPQEVKHAFFVPNIPGRCHVCPRCDSDPNWEPRAHSAGPTEPSLVAQEGPRRCASRNHGHGPAHQRTGRPGPRFQRRLAGPRMPPVSPSRGLSTRTDHGTPESSDSHGLQLSTFTASELKLKQLWSARTEPRSPQHTPPRMT